MLQDVMTTQLPGKSSRCFFFASGHVFAGVAYRRLRKGKHVDRCADSIKTLGVEDASTDPTDRKSLANDQRTHIVSVTLRTEPEVQVQLHSSRGKTTALASKQGN